MQVELCCPECCCRFAAPPDTSADEIIERMTDEGPWYALGDGETFEDMVHAALSAGGGAVTDIVRLLLVVPPLPVTVSVTMKLPTLLKVCDGFCAELCAEPSPKSQSQTLIVPVD